MKVSKRFLILLALVCLLAASAVAYAADWVKLGERHVNDKVDHDTILVTAARGKFDAVKFHVSGHAVHFIKVVVHYRNGTKQELELRDVIPAGGESRVIDLNGADRVIKKIDFWYEANSVGHAGANVGVWARR